MFTDVPSTLPMPSTESVAMDSSVDARGDFFEDLEVGTTLRLGSHRFTRQEIVAFACAYDPQPFHIDDAAAESSELGGLAASGWHTAVVWMRLYVKHRAAVRDALLARGDRPATPGPSPGFRDMRWRRPVHPGDTIAYRSVITGKRSLGRKAWGLVLHRNTGTNQHGQVAIEFSGSVFWQKRPPHAG